MLSQSEVVHLALTHLETEDSNARLLFLDFSSALIPQTLDHKLGLSSSLCSWVRDILTNRKHIITFGWTHLQ